MDLIPRRRWFSTEIIIDSCHAFDTHVVDENYNDLFAAILTPKEYKMFVKLVNSYMFAILYKNHPSLRDAAFLRIKWKGVFEKFQ